MGKKRVLLRRILQRDKANIHFVAWRGQEAISPNSGAIKERKGAARGRGLPENMSRALPCQ